MNEYQWNIDYKKQGVENGFVIDHLYQVSEQTNTRWAYPSSDDIQIAQKKEVLHCCCFQWTGTVFTIIVYLKIKSLVYTIKNSSFVYVTF